ncbi:hypothetical protein [uncultured Tateyamaria sp.]|uniref:hypothetical protein n=1 Tax=Tateyamaria sp. 1078 TaxID=3417464 RepID=UPI00261C8463|nr:hypothetical protein [uncultured Tateyamaria sp.]
MQHPHHEPKPTYPVLIWIALSFIVGLALWAGVYWHTDGGVTGPPLLVSVGNAGLTLAFGGVLGGLIKKLFDDWDARRTAAEAQTAYFAQLLEDFKTVYNTVERARFLIMAHKSAKTYGEQMRDLPDAIILLHNVKRATEQGFPRLYDDLEGPIFYCTIFLKGLVDEYRDAYLTASRLQSQDELENKYLREKIADGYKEIESGYAHRGWDKIMSLPHMRTLLDATQDSVSDAQTSAFKTYEDAFGTYVDLASYALMLRMPGNEDGVRDPELDKRLVECRDAARAAKAKMTPRRAA